jgi:transposase, IS30 family
MSYTQLTQEERYQIYALKKAGHIQAEIAGIVGRDPGTISAAAQAAHVLTLPS